MDLSTELPALDVTVVVPIVGLVLVMWGFARRSQPLIWIGVAALLVLPALALVDRVLAM